VNFGAASLVKKTQENQWKPEWLHAPGIPGYFLRILVFVKNVGLCKTLYMPKLCLTDQLRLQLLNVSDPALGQFNQTECQLRPRVVSCSLQFQKESHRDHETGGWFHGKFELASSRLVMRRV
jgi:hypothetical protein